jgi:thiol-disulfide isomerase/thioredoxin
MADTKTRTVANPDAGSNKLFTLAIIGILVLGLGAIAWVVTAREAISVEEQVAPVSIDGDVLPPMADSGLSADPSSDPTIGTQLPTVTGTNFAGTEVVIDDDGRAKAVYFLAHWCPHCQAELPRIVELVDDGKQPDNLDIYAISTSVDASRGGAYPPQTWFDREGFEGFVIRDSDSNSAFSHFGGGGFPYAVYVDADNNIVARSSGELPPETIETVWQIAAGANAG